MRLIFVITCSVLALCLCTATRAANTTARTQSKNAQQQVPKQKVPKQQNLSFTADAAGNITSLKFGGTEILDAPIKFAEAVGSSGNATTQLQGNTVKVTLNPSGDKISRWKIAFNDQVAAVEKLQDDSVSGAEAIDYTDSGETRAMPLTKLYRTQRARLYLRNGMRVLFWHDGWSAPMNLDEIGWFQGTEYTGNPLQNKNATTIHFSIESAGSSPLSGQTPISIAGTVPGNVFFKGESIFFTVNFNRSRLGTAQLQPASTLRWTVTDFWKKVVAQGQLQLTAEQLTYGAPVAVRTAIDRSGWFRIVFELVPVVAPSAGSQSATYAPSQAATQFSVLNRDHDRLSAEQLLTSSAGEPYAALLRLRCWRQARQLDAFFPEKGNFVQTQSDGYFRRCADVGNRFMLNWFYLGEARPAWCSDTDYSNIGQELATRYGQICKTIEPVNEPNFKMDAKKYLASYTPIYSGIKSARPDLTVLGPSCVSLPLSIDYLRSLAGSKHPFDNLAVHSYTGPGEPWELYGNREYFDELRKFVPAVPMWITEGGYDWTNVSKQQHARYVVRQFLNAHAAGIPTDRHSYFYMLHNGFEPWYLVEGGCAPEIDGTLLPAAVALRVMNEQVPQGIAAEVCPSPPGITALRYAGANDDVIAIWTLDFECTASLGGDVIKAVDFMGNEIESIHSASAPNSLSLTGYPSYVRVPRGQAITISAATDNLKTPEVTSATASTVSGANTAQLAFDNRWKMRDGVTGMNLPIRTFWQDATPGASTSAPDWIEFRFKPHPVSKIMLLMPLPAVESCPRDLTVKVRKSDGQWVVAGKVKDNESWVVFVPFANPVHTDGIRVEVTRVNDGWFKTGKWEFMVRDGFKDYTDRSTRILDILTD